MQHMLMDLQYFIKNFRFSYNEMVTISGVGFQPETLITITITLPDVSIATWNDVISDMNGDFVTEYIHDGVPGQYSVTASDGLNIAESPFGVFGFAMRPETGSGLRTKLKIIGNIHENPELVG